MIICFIGTRAQTIKMAPALLEMERRRLPFRLVLTGQHEDTIDQLITEFGISTAPVRLYQGKEISGIMQMGLWFVGCLWTCLRHSRHIFGITTSEANVILVHGDTVSTLLGAVVGRLLRIDVAHIEAGLRSRNLLHPFPEELTRLAVFRLSTISFCPGTWAYDNLSMHETERIDTRHNTLIDALSIALASPIPKPDLQAQPIVSDYGIVSIHRFENIFSPARLTRIIELIETAAARHQLVFVLHPSTRKKLTEYNLLQRIESNSQIQVVARMGYIRFVQLMRNALFVISDGGGNQEELSYLGIPTLLMRKATERKEGLGQTATLCAYEEKTLIAFLDRLAHSGQLHFTTPQISPSSMIVDRITTYAVAG